MCISGDSLKERYMKIVPAVKTASLINKEVATFSGVFQYGVELCETRCLAHKPAENAMRHTVQPYHSCPSVELFQELSSKYSFQVSVSMMVCIVLFIECISRNKW